MLDIKQNVLIDVKARTTEAQRGLGEILKRINALDEAAKNAKPDLEKAMNAIGLGAEAQLSRLQRLNTAFQGLTSKVALGADRIAKSMAPWSLALDLAGKAADHFDAALSATAKKYPSYAKDVDALRSSFGGLKEEVTAAMGVMAVEIYRPVRPLEELERRVDALRKKLRGEGPQGSAAFFGDNEALDFWGATGGGSFTESTGVDFFSRVGNKLDAYTKKVEKTAEAHKKAALEAARWRAELAGLSSRNAASATDALVAQLEQETAFSAAGSGLAGFGNPGAYNNADLSRQMQALTESTNARGYEQFRSRQQGSFLESAFGPIEEFNAYSTAFNTLTTATQSAMQAWISGSESLGSAIKKGIGTALAGLASSMAVESLKHFAYAAGSLAFGDFRGAGQHAVAGGLFGAGAAAAAVAAKKLGGGGASATASGGGASAGASGGSAGGGGQSYGQGSKPQQAQNTYVIVYGEHFYSESNRMRQLDAKRFVQAAVGNGISEQS